ncbi:MULTISPECIES: MFS transporter [unclassified Flavobacterium]|uniref:MDR family MFS transporter n=1 Tax=unclassified Flavobacterium TaxID=196869 RepID=UPI001F147C98|nr:MULTISPECIES: MFS transporter [unclassified Flavobacterium]UMY65266.1 MFS transporter [Flavobacterium sp. HJ-32-4]
MDGRLQTETVNLLHPMLRHASHRYVDNFRGFSREIWILAGITFVNRAGAMVIPFLSKYLHEDLHFSLSDVGTVMMAFGAGSLLGSFIGGRLADRIGFYKVMVFSLFTNGLLLFALERIHSFTGLCLGIFLTMTVADMFRPAMFVSVASYATPETRTRAFSLVRLAVNLGFAAGPALGGLLILGIGYSGLFWVDGATCILAITVFALLVKERNADPKSQVVIPEHVGRTPWNDRVYWLFLFVSFLGALVFFQILSTFPIYTRDGFGFTEFETGLLMTLNGLLVFLCEMPIVGFFERKHVDRLKVMLWGMLVLAFGYVALWVGGPYGVLIVYTVAMSYGEMFLFPFSNSFANHRAPAHVKGAYMALFTMTFSFAHIVGAKLGLETVDRFGYTANWALMSALALLGAGCCLLLQRRIQQGD